MRNRMYVLLVFAMVAAGCGGGESLDTTDSTQAQSSTTTVAESTTEASAVVTSTEPEGDGAPGPEVVAGEQTQDIWVYSPSGEGPWPIAFALPGSGGDGRQDIGVLATELAKRGVLVFVTDWRAEGGGFLVELDEDAECGYRYVRSIAEEYGGDLNQPVTMIGFDLGATFALRHALSEASYGPESTDDACAPGVARPDVVIAIQGCYDRKGLATEPFQSLFFDYLAEHFDNTEAKVVLMSGSEDTSCGPFKSKAAEMILTENGFDVTLVEVAEAGHGGLVFHDFDNDWAEYPVEYTPGQQTVETIVSAIESAR